MAAHSDTDEIGGDGPGEGLPPIPPFAWRGSLSPLLLLPASLAPLALLFAPSNVLQSTPSLRSFCNWVAKHIPNVGVHASSTEIPEVALLVDCLSVAVVPVLALVVFLQTLYNYKYLFARHLATGPHRMRTYFIPLVGVPLSLVLLAVMVMVPGDPSWAEGYTTDRTFFYAFLVFMMPMFAGYMLGTPLLFCRLFVNAYLFPASARRRR